MSIFQPVTLTWSGNEYTIGASGVLRAIAIVEETITLHELMQYQARGTAPLAKLATAFSSVLRYAGASVTDEEVYAAMFKGDQALSTSQAISALLLMMVPKDVATGSAEGNVSSGEERSSKKSSRRSSAAPTG